MIMDEQKNKKNQTDEVPRRSMLLWCLAGIYLLYTGYSLCSNVVKGTEGGGIGFFLAGIVFLIIGCGLLFGAWKGYRKLDRLRKEREGLEKAEAEETAEDAVEEITEAESVRDDETSQAAPRKMSIAERAALVNRVENGEDTEE